jgi:hypothetical protein
MAIIRILFYGSNPLGWIIVDYSVENEAILKMMRTKFSSVASDVWMNESVERWWRRANFDWNETLRKANCVKYIFCCWVKKKMMMKSIFRLNQLQKRELFRMHLLVTLFNKKSRKRDQFHSEFEKNKYNSTITYNFQSTKLRA